ncbi:hypothetical protein [Streptomyces sp. NPDC002671]
MAELIDRLFGHRYTSRGVVSGPRNDAVTAGSSAARPPVPARSR